jgi:hypothetical protein
VLDLCATFHCLPSEILKEDAALLKMLNVRALGTRKETVR